MQHFDKLSADARKVFLGASIFHKLEPEGSVTLLDALNRGQAGWELADSAREEAERACVKARAVLFPTQEQTAELNYEGVRTLFSYILDKSPPLQSVGMSKYDLP